MTYEALLLVGVLLLGFFLPHALLGAFAHRAAPALLLWAHLHLLLAGYFIWFWKHGGQTLAMKTWHIRLEPATGKPLTTRRLAARYLLSWPSVLLFGIGILWSWLDRDQQFLHDRLAGTRLVRTS